MNTRSGRAFINLLCFLWRINSLGLLLSCEYDGAYFETRDKSMFAVRRARTLSPRKPHRFHHDCENLKEENLVTLLLNGKKPEPRGCEAGGWRMEDAKRHLSLSITIVG